MTVVVTGGTGIVGTAVVRRLVEQGRHIRCLTRSAEADEIAAGLGASSVRGDITEPLTLLDAMMGAEVVYHIAGVNTFCVRDPAPMFRANVEGTRNVIRAAHAAGVRRVVYTSSAIVLGEEAGTVGSETSEHRGSFHSNYERSKFEAEQVAFAEARGIELIAVNPSSVQGPGRATGTGGLILDVINGRLPVMVDSVLSVVDIDDCAEGHVRAETAGVPGERYVLNGFSISVREALDILGGVLGRPFRLRFVPRAVARAAVPLLDLANRFRTLPFCGEMVRAMLAGHRYDGSKATRDLGLVYRSADETLRRTVDWFGEQGLIDP